MDQIDKHMLLRARNYPYDSPNHSFVIENGAVKDFNPQNLNGRVPVLAFGSNKAPEQLRRKFGHLSDYQIPVEMIRLHHFDVVFAAHITSYGAVPAMLQYCPDVVVNVAITWLEPELLEIMHKTELYAANYSFGRLDKLTVDRFEDDMPLLETLFAYVGERGHLASDHDGNAFSIKSISAFNRRWPEMDCGSLLDQIHLQHGQELTSDAFIARLVVERNYRMQITETLSAREYKFNYNKFEKIC